MVKVRTPTLAKNVTRQPTAKPSFSISDIRAVIPKHCFHHSLVTSFAYLTVNIVVIALLYYAAKFIDGSFTFLPSTLRFAVHSLLWIAYWIAQGCVGTGLWVIGHECGHGGFYSNELVCDVVGFVVHSFLLVPYFSWKLSHRRHHSNTNNLNRDEVFVPEFLTVAEAAKHDGSLSHVVKEHSEETLVSSAKRLANIAAMLLLGWPLYLLTNATSHKSHKKTSAYGLPPNHFMPSSPVFQKKEGSLILLSDIGILVMGFVLFQFAQATSFAWLVKSFVVPYLIVNMWLVLITFLQHTHNAVAHYTEPRWEWLQGALATIDRDFGILNHVFHHIGDTHVVHHLFSTMPHYHALEATRAVKQLLGDYYMVDNTPIFKALYDTFAHSSVVVEQQKGSGVFWLPN